MAVQHLESQQVGDTKIILWHLGKDRYQIETIHKTNYKVFNFDGEYNEAVCTFIMEARKLNNA